MERPVRFQDRPADVRRRLYDRDPRAPGPGTRHPSDRARLRAPQPLAARIRAAREARITQPTLSTQIKKLEGELGVQLVERSPKNIMLTPVGEEIADRARLVLSDVHSAIRDGARTTGSAGGHKMQNAFVVAQLALAVVIVAGAGLLESWFDKDKGERPEAARYDLEPSLVFDGGQHGLLNRRRVVRHELARTHLMHVLAQTVCDCFARAIVVEGARR